MSVTRNLSKQERDFLREEINKRVRKLVRNRMRMEREIFGEVRDPLRAYGRRKNSP